MLNFIRNLKMIDYDSKKTRKVYPEVVIWELIISFVVSLITVKSYDKIKRTDDNEDMDDEKFEIETAKIQEKNIKLWCGTGILLWIVGLFALFKMDYTTIGEMWDRHFGSKN